MILWRVCDGRFADLSGEGARLNGGRWNTRGFGACYLAEHPALAMLEVLVHLGVDPDLMPDNYVLMTVVAPDNIETEGINHKTPPENTEAHGTNWLISKKTPLLHVPSMLLPQSYNIVLNPAHPQAADIHVKEIEPLWFDPRFFSTN